MGRNAGRNGNDVKAIASRICLASAFFVLLFLMTPLSAVADGNRDKGEELSRQYCARCHVVADDDPFAGIGSTPSFMLLVNALQDWEQRFDTFYARPPHPVHVRIDGIEALTNLPSNAAPIDLSLGDVANILAYARSLKRK